MTEEHITIFSEILHYPKEFFYLADPESDAPTCDFFHRKRSDLPARTLKQIHATIEILKLNVSRLFEDFENTHEFFPLKVKNYGTPEAVAAAVRQMWKLPSGPIDSMIGSLEKARGIVIDWPFGSQKLDAISQWTPPFSPFVFVNSDAPGDRIRFTLAHELGHIIMHDHISDGMESEADRFAAAFLMPAKDIESELFSMNLDRAAALKTRWKVSMAALIKRARDLNQINDWQYKNLFIDLGKRGYRLKEPNPIPKEKPSQIKDIIKNEFMDEKWHTIDSLCKKMTMHEIDFVRYLTDESTNTRSDTGTENP